MQITIAGKTYDLALSPGDLKAIKAATGAEFLDLNARFLEAEVLSQIAFLAIRPRGQLTQQQIDDDMDIDGLETVIEFVLTTIEKLAKPAADRAARAEKDPSA